MPKSIRMDKRGRILEVYPWSVAELRQNKLYHRTLVDTLRDCPEPVEENWYFHGHRAYRYAPESFKLKGKRINARMLKADPDNAFELDEKAYYDTASLELRIQLAEAGFDPDVILARESAGEKVKGVFGF